MKSLSGSKLLRKALACMGLLQILVFHGVSEAWGPVGHETVAYIRPRPFEPFHSQENSSDHRQRG